MMEQPQRQNHDSLRSICDLTKSRLGIACSTVKEDQSDCESEWGRDDDEFDKNAFDAFDDLGDN